MEAGRKGGQASVLSRKLRPQRELERRIAEETRNGYALLKLAELEARRNRELERAIRDARAEAEREARIADLRLCDLLDEVEETKAEPTCSTLCPMTRRPMVRLRRRREQSAAAALVPAIPAAAAAGTVDVAGSKRLAPHEPAVDPAPVSTWPVDPGRGPVQ